MIRALVLCPADQAAIRAGLATLASYLGLSAHAMLVAIIRALQATIAADPR